MKSRIMLITILMIFVLTCGASAAKTFYWYDMMERPQLRYTAGHGMLSYQIQPVEYRSGQAVHDGDEQLLELTYAPNSKSEWTLHFDLAGARQTYSSTYRTYLLRTTGLMVTLRGGAEYYRNSNTGADKWISDAAIVTEYALAPEFKLHNNGEIRFDETEIPAYRLENGFTYRMNNTSSFQGNLNTSFSEGTRAIHSLELAYKTPVVDTVNFIFYATKRFDRENAHFENILEFKPQETTTLKANLILNTVESASTDPNLAGTWMAFKIEQGLFNASVFADYLREAQENGYSCLRVGVNLKL